MTHSSTSQIPPMNPIATRMATMLWRRTFAPIVLCMIGFFWSVSASARLALPNPLPPASPRCIDDAKWRTPTFSPRDCYTTLARFHVRVVADRIMTPFEFLAPEAPPATVFPQVRLPEKYRHETCTLALVMLNGVDPRELHLPPRSTFSPRDISTYDDIENAVLKIANECLSKYEQNETEFSSTNSLGFTSRLGWASQGLTGAIGVFLWATGSDIDRRTRYPTFQSFVGNKTTS